MKRIIPAILALSLFLSACQPTGPAPTPSPVPALPSPNVQVSNAPDLEAAVQAYLELWKQEDYASMYAQLSQLSRGAITPEIFAEKHRKNAINLTQKSIDFKILSSILYTNSAQVAYSLDYQTNLLGEIERQSKMDLVLENGSWRVQWEDAMMLPELTGGNYLELVLEIPARGNIYASDASQNYPLVAMEDAFSVRLVPKDIDGNNENDMLLLLAEALGTNVDHLKAKYVNVPTDWLVILGDITAETAKKYANRFENYPAIQLVSFRSRFYYDGGIAPHVTGYMQPIPKEEAERYQRMGYSVDERVGMAGLEAWGESYLAGKRGAKLYVKDPQGQIVTRISDVKAEPAYSITTSINSRLQYWLQRSFGEDQRGAVVVMERDSGRILAMVSKPGYDPNVFNPLTYSPYAVADVTQDPLKPMYNRASQGVYPPGSVFKMVSMAAGLESGVFTPNYPYYCDSVWREMTGYEGKDWTYDKGYDPSGELSLKEGLMRSCNPWFYHIGYTLWNDGYHSAIPDVAAGFGLGKKTGIEVAEFEGNLPRPDDIFQYVQMSIGQSTLQVSPLQVANYTAALGNGGILHRPSLVDRVALMNQTPVYAFSPEEIGKLPLTPENLTAIQEAMISVIRNPRGTAYDQFRSVTGNIAGKTGTAENSNGVSHAWFTAYTFNNNPNYPDVVITVILENAGEGSEMAVPLFKRALSLYYSNSEEAGPTLPWEKRPYVPVDKEE